MAMRPPPPPPAVPLPAPPFAEMMPDPAMVSAVNQTLPPAPPPLLASPAPPSAEISPSISNEPVMVICNAPPPMPPNGENDDPLALPPGPPASRGVWIDPYAAPQLGRLAPP